MHLLLSLLFSAFNSQDSFPDMFMKIAIVPIIKNKAGNPNDKNNYRQIALVTAASHIFLIMPFCYFRRLFIYS